MGVTGMAPTLPYPPQNVSFAQSRFVHLRISASLSGGQQPKRATPPGAFQLCAAQRGREWVRKWSFCLSFVCVVVQQPSAAEIKSNHAGPNQTKLESDYNPTRPHRTTAHCTQIPLHWSAQNAKDEIVSVQRRGRCNKKTHDS